MLSYLFLQMLQPRHKPCTYSGQSVTFEKGHLKLHPLPCSITLLPYCIISPETTDKLSHACRGPLTFALKQTATYTPGYSLFWTAYHYWNFIVILHDVLNNEP